MALNKEKLIADIIKIQQEMLKKEAPDFEFYAQKLATAIDEFVKSGDVIVSKGIAVQAGTYAGATIAEGKGTIK